MKALFILFSLCWSISLFSQEKVIAITHPEQVKTWQLVDGERIRLKTMDGERYSGEMKILDDETLIIRGKEIRINDIAKIKRHPRVLTVLTGIAMTYFGSGFVGAGVLWASISGISAPLLLVIPGGALIYGAFDGTNVLRSFKRDKGFEYQVVSASITDKVALISNE